MDRRIKAVRCLISMKVYGGISVMAFFIRTKVDPQIKVTNNNSMSALSCLDISSPRKPYSNIIYILYILSIPVNG